MNDELLSEWLNPNSGWFTRAGHCLEKFRSPHQQIEVYETPDFGRLFRLDGAFMSSERDEFFYHENLVHLPALAHREPKSALVLGGGDGGSAKELLKHPSMERVVIAELDQAVVDIARRHLPAVHRGALDNPKVEICIGDGLAYVRNSQEAFDLILFDLTDPGGASAPLHTAEFYAACRARLAPGGALALHIGSPLAQPERFRASVRDLRSVFAIVRPYTLFIPLYGTLWGMACASDSLDPALLTAQEVESRLGERGIADLRYYNGDTHRAVLAQPNYLRALLAE